MSKSSQHSDTCAPGFVPLVSRRGLPFTPRRAVDSTGLLGSFYDASCDTVLESSNMSFTPQTAESKHPPFCSSETCASQAAKNLLKWYHIHYELRLSVALQMVRNVGVGALINYSRPIDKYTRFICYTNYSRTDYISDDEFQSMSRNKSQLFNTSATHVIVMINWGIDAVAILQLPHDDASIVAIDDVIRKLCTSLKNDEKGISLSNNDQAFIQKITHTDVFSNIPELSEVKSIIDFHREISRVKGDNNLLKPYNYNLCSIASFYTANNTTQGIFKEMLEDNVVHIELDLIPLVHRFEKLRIAINQYYQNLEAYLKNYVSEMRTRWSYLQRMYSDEIQRLGELVTGIRRGKIDHEMICSALNDDKNKQLVKNIEDFEYHLSALRKKYSLICDLLRKQITYQDASQYDVVNGDDERTIQRKLLSGQKFDIAVCFNDILLERSKLKWDQLIAQSVKGHIIFVDFSYCSRELDGFMIFSTSEGNNDRSTPEPLVAIPLPARPKTDGTINILLLGESGVGKSTFINALANYLTFDKLKDAEKDPAVLIPVHFVITFGDNFEEKQVKFSKEDDLHNEDYEHIGQSVTQHCKSYVFTLDDNDNRRRKLRIIDTPGIGDVRGAAQDDINMQHILSFMTNLTHLNAICILLKPNNARLNISFRSCLTQLFDLLGEDARDKIIFCFTNSRATFYTPGDTGPLLRKLLESLPIKDIPFNKCNTFCFDSESFRYLVAKRNEIRFSESEEQDYKESWGRSSNESRRFLEYIRTKTNIPLSPGDSESMKHAQLKITVLIRPILESMRNILRNIVLWDKGARTKLIELRPKRIRDTTGICSACSRQYTQLDDFWITRDSLHYFHKNCRTCQCDPSDHYSVDYQLEYSLCDRRNNHSNDEMTKTVDGLCKASAEFGCFLVRESENSENDPFLAGIERMIKEESVICKTQASSQFNADLRHHLEELKKNYEEKRRSLLAQKDRMDLSKIYARIEDVSKYEMIKSQMAAAREWFKFRMKHYEDEVLT